MTGFVLSLRTTTPIVISRWLTLDAILDGIQIQNGVPDEERIIPIYAFDGRETRSGLTSSQVADGDMVFFASAAMPDDVSLQIAPKTAGHSGRAAVAHPALSSVTFRGGIRPHLAFTDRIDGTYPYQSIRKFDTTTGNTGGMMQTKRTILPSRIEWVAQGDPDAVLAILAETEGIGAKTSNGFGIIDHSTIRITPVTDHPAMLGIVDEGGAKLVRPVPADLFPGAIPFELFHHRIETVRPPYWDRRRETHALVPKTTIANLLTR